MFQRFGALVLGAVALGVGCNLVVEASKYQVAETTAGGGGATATTTGVGGLTAVGGSGGVGGPGGAAGAPSCGWTTGCDACQYCAVGTPCVQQWNDCANDSECNALQACVTAGGPCGATPAECYVSCGNQHQAGVTLAMSLAQCVFCQQCVPQCPENAALCKPPGA